MDKNTLIGFALIAAIVIGFTWLNKPTDEQIELQKRYNDSIALVQQKQAAEVKKDTATFTTTNTTDSINGTIQSSVNADLMGEFNASATGKDEFQTIENEFLKVKVANKGGQIASVEVKNFKTHDKKPLVLFDGSDENKIFYTLSTNNGRVVNTSNLYCEPIVETEQDAKGNRKLTMRLKTTDPTAYIDFIYTLAPKDYMVHYDVKSVGMNRIMPSNTNSLEMQWNAKIRQQEKGRKFEEQYSNIHFMYLKSDIEKLSNTKDDKKEINTKLKWVAFKDQFFSSIIIADSEFTSSVLNSKMMDASTKYVKEYGATLNFPFDPAANTSTGFRFYFGPNQYKILNEYDKGLPAEEELKLRSIIPLGWGIFGWINRFMIIPMFNVFSLFLSNFGIIILLMTIAIKLLLFPLTYKSYMSGAKMRVLKPEIDEINARIPADKPMERQKATMDMYNRVGVSPMSGCLPMLLQMPILFAMFSFFPSAFELRQQSFLWADDLSSYDAIVTFGTAIPLLGSHLSLFTILMTITSIFSTKLSMATNPQAADQPGASMMKWSMYLMPVMFFFMFNDYASGLSYYYFISSLITIIQTYVMRAFVDDKKLLAELHAKRNSKTPAKKSGFMERLEKMQREQQKAMQQRAKKR